jgi:hypothetical protein
VAITLEADDAAYDAIGGLIAGDGGANGLSNATQTVAGIYDSANYLKGGVHRRGTPQQTLDHPRLEIEIAGTQSRDTFDHASFAGIARIHIITNREPPITYPGFVSQRAISVRVRSVLNGGAPSTQGGWTFSVLHRLRGFQAPASDKEQHYIQEYQVAATAGAGGGI